MKMYKLHNGIIYRMPYFCEKNLKFYQIRKIATRIDKLGRRVATIGLKVVPVDKLQLEEMSISEVLEFFPSQNQSKLQKTQNIFLDVFL